MASGSPNQIHVGPTTRDQKSYKDVDLSLPGLCLGEQEMLHFLI